ARSQTRWSVSSTWPPERWRSSTRLGFRRSRSMGGTGGGSTRGRRRAASLTVHDTSASLLSPSSDWTSWPFRTSHRHCRPPAVSSTPPPDEKQSRDVRIRREFTPLNFQAEGRFSGADSFGEVG